MYIEKKDKKKKRPLGIPTMYIDDLLPFTPEGFVEELLPREWKH